MRFVLLSVLVLLLRLVTFSQSPAHQEIPFEPLPSGHMLVKAKVAGVEGRFIFDTDGGITAFTKPFLTKLPNTTAEDGGFTGIDGILSLKLLETQPFTIDLPGKMMLVQR